MESRFLATEEDTLALGAELAGRQPAGCVFLHGDLGAGKTTLVRGWLRGRGHQGAVKSPTYTLVEPYEIGATPVYHFDLYRLADPEELEWIGGRDYFSPDSLCLIEWPEKAGGMLPSPDLEIRLAAEGTGRQASLIWHNGASAVSREGSGDTGSRENQQA